ncbi:MAG: hypothetical protein U0795_24240 [Pirellulales bacterium]
MNADAPVSDPGVMSDTQRRRWVALIVMGHVLALMSGGVGSAVLGHFSWWKLWVNLCEH